MELDYSLIGQRIRKCRKRLGYTQEKLAELADTSSQYVSNIERAVSIPSTEVVMRLAIALDTTPDEFLVGTSRAQDEEWKSIAQYLQAMNKKQLELAKSFLQWLSEQDL